MNETLKFNARFQDIKPINPMFSYCKIYTLYTLENRNNSFISKDAVIKAIPSLFNIPIIGEHLEQVDNFGSHGGKIEITDKGVEFIVTTKPYGLIPESAEIYWENVTELDGSVKEYLVIDKAILWTGRYSDLDDLLNQKYGQSMEIDVIDGSFIELNKSKIYEIRNFTFSALCILGIDKDGEGHVEPAFESASISTYSLDGFKSEFNQMIKEFKYSLQQIERDSTNSVVAEVTKEGGNNKVPENILALLEKFGLNEIQLLDSGIVFSDFSIEELEAKLTETFQNEEVVVEPVVEVAFEAEVVVEPVVELVVEDAPVEFTLTVNQLEDELRRELSEIETLTEVYYDDVYTYPRYYYRDCKSDQNVVIAMDEKNWYLVGFSYKLEGDKVEVDKSSISRYKIDYNPMDLSGGDDMFQVFSELTSKSKSEFMLQAKEKELTKLFEAEKVQIKEEASTEFTKLQSEFATLQQQYSTLESKTNQFESELSERVKQERLDAETSIFESFSVELTEDEMKTIKENASALSLDEITDKLFSISGRKKASFGLREVKNTSLSYQLPLDIKKTSGKDYDDLFERHLKKEEE